MVKTNPERIFYTKDELNSKRLRIIVKKSTHKR